MRITTNQMAMDSVANVDSTLSQLQGQSQVLSTGLAVNLPSDNPVAAGQIVSLNAQVDQDNGFNASAQSASTQLNAANSALGQVVTLLQNVQTQAETGLNSATESSEDLQTLATSVYGSLQQILNLSNTQSNGQSLFAGFQVQGPAFTSTTNAQGQITAVTYQGDSGVNQAQVGQDVSVATNLPGDQVFDAAGASVFQSVIAVAQALQSGGGTALSTALSQLQAAQQTVIQSQSQTGALVQTLQGQETALGSLSQTDQTQLGNVQNADMAKVATAYQQALIAYQSGIQSAGLVAQLPSVANYL